MKRRGTTKTRKAGLWLSTLSVLVAITATSLILPACSLPDTQKSEAASATPTTPESRSSSSPALEHIRKRGTLRIATLRAPITFYADEDQDRFGPELDLATAFARSLGVKPVYIVANNREQIYTALSQGQADIAAAGLAMTLDRKHDFHFSKPLATTRQQLVCRRFGEVAKTPEDLPGVRLEVTDDLASLATLWALEYRHQDIEWVTQKGASQELMLWKVWNNEVDCTLADSHIVALAQRVMPELQVMFNASEQRPVAWATRRDDRSLMDAVDQWIAGEGAANIAAAAYEYYRGDDNFDYVDTRILIRRIISRFPRYRDLLEQAGKAHQLDPWLLAALSYQESHWNQHAKSPTGVRGLMMLTRSTAKALGVTNRLDPKQVIPAGARYLAELRETFDASIPEPDRTYMALAAYNMGRARLHQAQRLARQHGKNPHRWLDLKKVLPLLCEQKPGSCRGHRYNLGAEAVRYVDRIHFYRDIIEANQHEHLLLAYKNSHMG